MISMTMRLKLSSISEKEKKEKRRSYPTSYEDRIVWFIWIGLVLISIAALPFIARMPDLVVFVADLCLTIVPL